MYQENQIHHDAALKGYQNAQMGGLVQRAQEPRSGAFMEQAFEDANAAIGELSDQVEELLMRIAPVCAPGTTAVVDGAGSKSPEISPSPMRGELMKLRSRVQNISSLISSVRFTIEI